MQTLDILFIRYLNLFEKITGIRIKNCFFYNNFVVFGVPSSLMARAIGEGGMNVKRLSELLKKKIKIVALPENISSAGRFVSAIVNPVRFKNLEIRDEEIIITAGQQNKASLIGRNKARLGELSDIVGHYFNKKLRIV